MDDVKTNGQASATSLVQGIVGDIGELIKHEVRFARAEFLSDLGKLKTAAAFLLAGGAAGAVGLVLFSLMAAHGLHNAGLPLWAAYGVVGAALAAGGAALGWVGSERLSRVNPLPEKTLQNVQEDVSWIANQTANSK